jgi:hypothetical protein
MAGTANVDPTTTKAIRTAETSMTSGSTLDELRHKFIANVEDSVNRSNAKN